MWNDKAVNVMDEKKFAVLLTDTQDVKVVECDPQEEIFGIARGFIGCDWIELVEADPLADKGYLLLIDEEGKLRDGDLSINCIASDLYGADQHGDPIIGNALVVRAQDESLELMTENEAKELAAGFEQSRDRSIEKISRAFGLMPQVKKDPEIGDAGRRQPCRKDGMER